MGRKKRQVVANKEVDDLLDQIAGPDVGDEDDEQPAAAAEAKKVEAATEPKETEAEKTEPEEDAVTEPEEPSAAEAKAEVDSEDAEVTADPADDKSKAEDQEKAKEAALLRQISELRAKLRKATAAQQAPSPIPPPQQPAAQSQTTADMLDDLIVFNDGKAGIDRYKLAEFVKAQTAPSQQELDQRQYEAFKSGFIAENPAHAAALAKAEQAYTFVTLAAQEKAQEWGVPIHQLGLDGFLEFARSAGVMDQVSQHFPELAEDLPELLFASHTKSNELMGRTLRRYAARLNGGHGGQNVAVTQTQRPQGATVTPLPANRPPSLAGVGSTTPTPKRGERERLELLEKEANLNPLMDPERVKEMEALQAKFGL